MSALGEAGGVGPAKGVQWWPLWADKSKEVRTGPDIIGTGFEEAWVYN